MLEKSAEDKTPVYHNVRIVERPILPLKGSEVLVRMEAVAFNHRDVGTCSVLEWLHIFVLVMASQGSISWYFTRFSAWSRWCR